MSSKINSVDIWLNEKVCKRNGNVKYLNMVNKPKRCAISKNCATGSVLVINFVFVFVLSRQGYFAKR